MSNDPQIPTTRPTASQSPPVPPKPTQREHFKVGEVVWLKSGSPAMTVAALLQGGETVTVIWMDRSNSIAATPHVYEKTFPRLCLTDKDPRLEELKNAILSSDLESETLRPYPPNEPRVIRVEIPGLAEALEMLLNRRVENPTQTESAPATTELTNAGQVSASRAAWEAANQIREAVGKSEKRQTIADLIETTKPSDDPKPTGLTPIKRR